VTEALLGAGREQECARPAARGSAETRSIAGFDRAISIGISTLCHSATDRGASGDEIDVYKAIIETRLAAYPELSAVRLLWEIRPAGFAGSSTQLKKCVRQVRPCRILTRNQSPNLLFVCRLCRLRNTGVASICE
jgi:hypothetical protein